MGDPAGELADRVELPGLAELGFDVALLGDVPLDRGRPNDGAGGGMDRRQAETIRERLATNAAQTAMSSKISAIPANFRFDGES